MGEAPQMRRFYRAKPPKAPVPYLYRAKPLPELRGRETGPPGPRAKNGYGASMEHEPQARSPHTQRPIRVWGRVGARQFSARAESIPEPHKISQFEYRTIPASILTAGTCVARRLSRGRVPRDESSTARQVHKCAKRGGGVSSCASSLHSSGNHRPTQLSRAVHMRSSEFSFLSPVVHVFDGIAVDFHGFARARGRERVVR